MKKWWRRLAILSVTLMVAEGGFRLAGFGPWHRPDPGSRIGGEVPYSRYHPEVGYVGNPGTFPVTLATGHTFTIHRDERGRRRTRPPGTAPGKSGAIWIFGCSFTNGWSLADQETYPWLVQSALPGYEVDNFGMDGYGTVHCLLRFRMALRNAPPPAIVIYAYGALLHDRRNTLWRGHRKAASATTPRPTARVDGDGGLRIEYGSAVYKPWPGQQTFALVHALEKMHNSVQRRLEGQAAIAQALIKEFAGECSNRSIRFLVAGIADRGTRERLEWCAREGITNLDISVDSRDPAYKNLPHDNHPNAKANAKYAADLVEYLRSQGWVG